MGFKPTARFYKKKHKELKVLVFIFKNSNEKHNVKSLSGIQTHLPMITLLQRTELMTIADTLFFY